MDPAAAGQIAYTAQCRDRDADVTGDSAVASQEHPGRPRGRVLAGNSIDALARNYADQAPGDIGVGFVNPPERSLRIVGRDISQSSAAGPSGFSGAFRGSLFEVGEESGVTTRVRHARRE